MRALIWKLRYAVEMRRSALLPWLTCWEFAGSHLEMVKGDLDECSPAEAVESELSYWNAD